MRQVHNVGLYCPYGASVAEHLNHDAHRAAGQSPISIPGSVMDRIDIITSMLVILDDHIDCCFRYLWKGIWCCWGLYCRFQGICWYDLILRP